MTQKVAVTFKRGYGVYNAGETAGFDQDHAFDLINAGIAVKAKDQPKPATIVASLAINIQDMPEFLEVKKALEEAGQQIDLRSAALDQREAELNAREAELDRRSADLDALADALAEGDADETVIETVTEAGEVTKPDADAAGEKAAEKPAGLPKQGRSGA